MAVTEVESLSGHVFSMDLIHELNDEVEGLRLIEVNEAQQLAFYYDEVRLQYCSVFINPRHSFM